MSRYSLIVPVYNAALLLPRLFKQLEKITYNDLELIFVNDGSTDTSLEVLNKFACEKSNVIIISQENTGAGYARNIGLSRASGKYVWFTDSDDIINPDAFYEFDRIFTEHPETEILILSYKKFTHYKLFSFPVQYDAEYYKISSKYAILHTGYAPWTRVYPREFMLKQKFQFPKSSFAEDVAETLRMCCIAKNIIKTEFIGYGYYKNTNSIKNPIKYAKDLCISMKEIEKYKELYPCFQEEIELTLFYHTNPYVKLLSKESEFYNELMRIKLSVDLNKNVYGKLRLNFESTYWWKIGKAIYKVLTFFKIIR